MLDIVINFHKCIYSNLTYVLKTGRFLLVWMLRIFNPCLKSRYMI